MKTHEIENNHKWNDRRKKIIQCKRIVNEEKKEIDKERKKSTIIKFQ